MVGLMAGEVIHERLDHTERFAAYLRMLKGRSGLGFNQLGRLAGVSGSSLHRYCSGASVPQDYRIVLSFARSCGATGEEIRHLHRLWSAAEAVRRLEPVGPPPSVRPVAERPEPVSELPEQSGTEQSQPDGERPEPGGEAPVLVGESPGPVSEPPVEAGRSPELAEADGREPEPEPAPRHRDRYLALAAAVGVLVILATAGLFALRTTDDPGGAGTPDDRMLFSQACRDPISMGQHDDCVSEVQDLLLQAGAKVGVDGSFGPETLRRVTAFQVLAGLPARGVVDDATKKALYDQRVRMATWTPERVDGRIREVFPEDPDHAVAIARCQSRLDPLHITPNTNGSRNWGLFQISDSTLAALGGTPMTALDPEWNITAARQLWSGQRDFHHWPFCDAALNSAPPNSTPSGS